MKVGESKTHPPAKRGDGTTRPKRQVKMKRHSRLMYTAPTSSLNKCNSLTLGATLSSISHMPYVCCSKAGVPNNIFMFIIAAIVGPSSPNPFGRTTADRIGERQGDNNERRKRFPIFKGRGTKIPKIRLPTIVAQEHALESRETSPLNVILPITTIPS